MRIAIVGAGISGLVCAYVLGRQAQVTLFESNDYVGGHTHTVKTPAGHEVDTGFIVFNQENYPYFTGLLLELGVQSQRTSMSFSARCEATGLEYSTASLAHLFAQRGNLMKPAFYGMLRDIVRFNQQASGLALQLSESVTVREFLRRQRYGEAFARHFLYPISVALWSCPQNHIEDFPMRFIVEFYLHHGMHRIIGQPVWHVVKGGSHQYVKKLIVPFEKNIRKSCPVHRVERTAEQVMVTSAAGIEAFDEIIFACHSDQALRMLGAGASAKEREVLSAFPYSRNAVTLHTDSKVLPRSKRAWASWNSLVEAAPSSQARVTYYMNKLQSLRCKETYCVSLNQDERIAAGSVIKRMEYEHPRYDTRRSSAQRQHGALIRQQRTSFCGAYWGNGFHEAGVASAVAVCHAYGEQPAWFRTPVPRLLDAG